MNARRQIYGFIVRMHPAAFREEFGGEMMLDFEDASGGTPFAPLCCDALLSLARQWARWASPAETAQAPIQSRSLLAGHYAMVSLGRLTWFDLARATILAALLLSAIGFAATARNTRGIIGVQATRTSQRGFRGQASPAYGAASADGAGTAPVQSAALEQWRQDATGNKEYSMKQKAVSRVLEWEALVVMFWLTMQLLLRRPSVWKKLVLVGLGYLAIAAPMCAQILHASGPLPSFEVATLRPWQPPPAPPAPDGSAVVPKVKFSPGRGGGQATDLVHFIGQAGLLIAFAYNVQIGAERHLILGGQGWVYSEADRYELQAKIDDQRFAAMKAMSPAGQREQVALMEQSLLADRFKLKVHFETREMPVWTLVVAKGGVKLTPAKEGEASKLFMAEKGRGNEMVGQAVTLEQLAQSPLMMVEGKRVVDQTGLTGAYDFTLDFSPPAIAEAGISTDAPELFRAMEQQLGLRLVASKAQVEVIVIDHIERPSEN